MGKKYEKGTAKDLANKSKSKGLQKLRWYCEMCQKQCRDQHGFKCHLTSEAHQRQLLLFAETPEKYISEFSRDFESNFLHILKGSFGTKRIRANEVYQEYIKDKNHVHMNSTRWHTLTGFVQYLGKAEICRIDQNEKGWWIQLIDKEAEMRKEELEKKAKADKDDEQRQSELIEAQAERDRLLHGITEEHVATELLRAEDDEKVAFSLNRKPTLEELKRPLESMLLASGSVFDKKKDIKKEIKQEEDDGHTGESSRRRSRERRQQRSRSRSRSRERRDRPSTSSAKSSASRPPTKEATKRSALDEIRQEEERRKESRNRRDNWLHVGIVVKITTKALGSEHFKAKGVVRKLFDDFTAAVKLTTGVLVKVDQAHVETVIPAVGRQVLVVNGAYRGAKAVLDALDTEKYQVRVTIDAGPARGRKIDLPYEDVSKLSTDDD